MSHFDYVDLLPGPYKVAKEHAAGFVANVPVGTRMTVWYDPSDPSEAVIDPSLPSSSVLGLIVGLSMMMLGVAGGLRVLMDTPVDGKP